MIKEVWSIVNGDSVQPTADDKKELLEWKTKRGKAAGLIFSNLESDQRVHVKGFEEDPVQMWALLKSVHKLQRPTTRFNAYSSLFSIVKEENESLSKLITRVEDALNSCKDTRPQFYTLDDLDSDLAAMTLIRALPPSEFQPFTSSLSLLPQIDYLTVKEAILLEE
ncbi:hypothetical protein SISNIDRAFT_419599, partial [Sistotremastrum niveocremeum HHB9708]